MKKTLLSKIRYAILILLIVYPSYLCLGSAGNNLPNQKLKLRDSIYNGDSSYFEYKEYYYSNILKVKGYFKRNENGAYKPSDEWSFYHEDGSTIANGTIQHIADTLSSFTYTDSNDETVGAIIQISKIRFSGCWHFFEKNNRWHYFIECNNQLEYLFDIDYIFRLIFSKSKIYFNT